MVSAERGGGEHRSGRGIYAGSLGLGISYSCELVYLGHSDDCNITESLAGVWQGCVMPKELGMTETYREIE